MNLKYRRIIYLTFFALFLVITPVVVLYATGYRYDFKQNRFVKTGILYVDSKPSGAQILLNGQYQNVTPARFATLLPDAYQVTLTKDGYHSISKKIEVNSNLTTFGRDFVLFKNALPIEFIPGTINIFEPSADREKILFSVVDHNTENVQLLNLRNLNAMVIEQFDKKTYSSLSFVMWSPNQQRALLKESIGGFNKYLVIDTETLKVRDIFDITHLNFDRIRWDQSNENILYGTRNGILYQINLVTNAATNMVPEPVTDFFSRGNELYYITKSNGATTLSKVTFSAGQPKIDELKLPPSSFEIDSAPAGYIVLRDLLSSDLFIIKTDAFVSPDISQNTVLEDRAKKIIWSDDGSMILFFTDFELNSFNFSTQEKTLITRLSQTITDARWYAGNKYILYTVNATIHAIEAWPEETRIDTILAELTDLRGFGLDSSSATVYLEGTAGTKSGIYQLSLQ